MFYQLPPKALIGMCSKDLTHLHKKMEMWKTTKNVERESINLWPVGPTVSCTAPTVLRPATLVVVVLMKPKVSFQA